MHRALRFTGAVMTVVFLAGVSVTAMAASRSVEGRCLLEVQQKQYLNGPCPLVLEADGGFTIGASEKRSLEYFAIVSITGKNTAEGFWNEERGATHAHTNLGKLTRNGACWQNTQTKVCAWKD